MDMHEGQLHPTAETVKALLAEQHPRLAGLAVRAVPSSGTVNALFRVGEDLVARLPLCPGPIEELTAWAQREQDAARRLAVVSPVGVPEPVALGAPGEAYPLPWSLYRWIPGRPASEADGDDVDLARALACFVVAVRSMPTQGRSFTGPGRGGELLDHDEYVGRAIERTGELGLMDADRLAARWAQLRELPRTEPDTWAHNDLMPGNLLVPARGGGLAAAIDVGTLGVADPAMDLQPAWNLLRGRARRAFLDGAGATDEQVERSRAWAFVQAIGCHWYYLETNPVMSRTGRITLEAVLDG